MPIFMTIDYCDISKRRSAHSLAFLRSDALLTTTHSLVILRASAAGLLQYTIWAYFEKRLPCNRWNTIPNCLHRPPSIKFSFWTLSSQQVALPALLSQ